MSTDKGILNYENEVEYWHSGVTYWGLEGGYSYNENNLLQCRIAFFNLDYPDEPNKNSNGYMYNTKKRSDTDILGYGKKQRRLRLRD